MSYSGTENSLLSSILKSRPKLFQNKRISEINSTQIKTPSSRKDVDTSKARNESIEINSLIEEQHALSNKRDRLDHQDNSLHPEKRFKSMNTKSFYSTSMLRIQHVEERVLRFLADIRQRITSKQKPAPWQHFPTQQPAFDFADNKDPTGEFLRVFSVELSDTGKRRFLVTTYTEFWKRYKNMIPCHRHYYEIIRQHWPCHLYLDLECNTADNPDFDGQRAIDAVINLIGIHFRKHFQLTMDPSSWIIELDSTTKTKFSRHLIIRAPGAAFASNAHVGAFMSEVCAYAHTHRGVDPCCAVLFVKKGDSEVSFIDSGVYTKNRAFRLHLSSKAGKETPLLPTNRFFTKDSCSSQEQIFMASLICNVAHEARLLQYYACTSSTSQSNPSMNVEITAGTARHVSHRKSALHANSNMYGIKSSKPRDNNAGTMAQDTGEYVYQTALGYGPSPFPTLDAFIESICNEGGIQGRIRSWAFLDTGNVILYNIKGNRFCGNINRHHKSNSIYFVVDLQHGVWFQKCYDPECRRYRSPAMPLPVELGEHVAWEGIEDEEREEEGDLLWGTREESRAWDEAALQIECEQLGSGSTSAAMKQRDLPSDDF